MAFDLYVPLVRYVLDLVSINGIVRELHQRVLDDFREDRKRSSNHCVVGESHDSTTVQPYAMIPTIVDCVVRDRYVVPVGYIYTMEGSSDIIPSNIRTMASGIIGCKEDTSGEISRDRVVEDIDIVGLLDVDAELTSIQGTVGDDYS